MVQKQVWQQLFDHGPLICVPIVAASAPAALRQAELLLIHNPRPDLVELRVDHLHALDLEELIALLADMAALLGQHLPLLFTNRRAAEGGAGLYPESERIASMHAAIASGHIALIDCELAIETAIRAAIVTAAHAHGVGVIISAHDFTATPPDVQLDSWLAELAAAGGDAAKLAVMAQSPDDALRLLAATARARDASERSAASSKPLITLAMGSAGMVTRLAGPAYGSMLSYATIAASSAPGQLPIELVHAYWRAASLREAKPSAT